MGLKPYYLGDTSALARMTQHEIAVRLRPLLESGLVARCTPTDLEAGFSSTSPVSYRAMRELRSTWPFVAMDSRFSIERSKYRTSLRDLLIAAAAEAAGLVVLHYDHDFDLIATVTGQRTQWIVPTGTA